MIIRACAFDLGNTLVNDVSLQKNALEDVSSWIVEQGHKIDPAAFIATYNQKHSSNYGPFLSHTFGELVFFEDTLSELGIEGVSPERLLLKYRDFLMNRVEKDEEVPAALRYIRSRGMKTALLSNESTERVSAFMQKTGMEHLFDSIVVSKTVGYEKPDKRIFEITSSTLAIPPEEIIMFGDNEISDGACKKIGMIFVLVKNYKNHLWAFEKGEYFEPDFTIERVSEDCIKELFSKRGIVAYDI